MESIQLLYVAGAFFIGAAATFTACAAWAYRAMRP